MVSTHKKESNVSQDPENQESPPTKKYIPICFVLGLVFGIAFDEVAIGMVVGIIVGVVLDKLAKQDRGQ